MAEAARSPPSGGDETRVPTIIGVYCALTSVSLACVAARLYTRFHLLRSPGKDDAVTVLSMVSTASTFCRIINIFTCLGDCFYQLCIGMLRHKVGFRKTHILFIQRGDLASIEMELRCRSVGHHGYCHTGAGCCALLTENCGKNEASKDVVSILHHLCGHRFFGYRRCHSIPTMQSALFCLESECPPHLLESKRVIRH